MVDFYKMGTDVDEEADYQVPQMKREIRVGAVIYTPGAILAEMDTVKAQIETLDRDIRSASVRPVFLQAWDTFVKEWQTFYKDHEGWTDRLWGSAMEKTQDYGKRVVTWRDAFKKEGGKPTGPTIPGGGFPWKLALWGVGIVGGLIAGAVIVKEVGQTVRSFKGGNESEDG